MISFKSYLTELFDTKHTFDHDPEMEGKVRHHLNTSEYYKGKKYGTIKAFKLKDNLGHLVHAVKDGYHELHHIDSTGESANYKVSDKPNPKFVGAMMQYANENILGKNKNLKISAIKPVHDSVKGMVEKLAKKSGHAVSHGSENFAGEEVPYMIVHKKETELQEWFNNK